MTSKILIISSGVVIALAGCSQSDSDPKVRTNATAPNTAQETRTPFTIIPPTAEPSKVVFGGKCNIESFDYKPAGSEPASVSRRSALTITGWGFDPVDNKSPSRISVVLLESGKSDWNGFLYGAEAGRSVARPDVANSVGYGGSPDKLGFEVSATFANVPAGNFSMLTKIEQGEHIFLCDNGRKINVTD